MDPSGHDDALMAYDALWVWTMEQAEAKNNIIDAASKMPNGGGAFLVFALASLYQLPDYIENMIEKPAEGGTTSGAAIPPLLPLPSGKYTINEGDIGHIFGNRPGHLSEDTPTNRSIIENCANSARNLNGVDSSSGNRVYSQWNEDGTQTWAYVRNGKIVNGGVNEIGDSWFFSIKNQEWMRFSYQALYKDIDALYGEYLPPMDPWYKSFFY